MHHSRNLMLFLLAVVFLSAGCGSRQAEPAGPEGKQGDTETLNVMVSIVPQVFFVQRVGGGLVQVEPIAPPNYSAETYQITPRQMDALGRADIFFRTGMPFEEALTGRLKATFPALRVIDTRTGVPMLAMSAGEEHEGHEADEHGHVHGGDDPHIWLDPMRVKIQARTIAESLQGLLPGHSGEIARNLAAFEQELDELHRQVSETLAPVRGRAFYVFHPAFGYFADAFGLEQRAIEFEGKSPGPRRLYDIMNEIKGTGVRAIFAQPQFNVPELKTVAEETGVAVVVLDDLAADYHENIKRMAAVIAEYLR